MIKLCTFKDLDPWYPARPHGHNKTGYLTLDDRIIFPVRRHFVRIAMDEFRRRNKGRFVTVWEYKGPEVDETKV